MTITSTALTARDRLKLRYNIQDELEHHELLCAEVERPLTDAELKRLLWPKSNVRIARKVPTRASLQVKMYNAMPDQWDAVSQLRAALQNLMASASEYKTSQSSMVSTRTPSNIFPLAVPDFRLPPAQPSLSAAQDLARPSSTHPPFMFSRYKHNYTRSLAAHLKQSPSTTTTGQKATFFNDWPADDATIPAETRKARKEFMKKLEGRNVDEWWTEKVQFFEGLLEQFRMEKNDGDEARLRLECLRGTLRRGI